MAETIVPVNRKEFAVGLRQAGLAGVDFEDWSGLSDPQMLGLVQYMHQIRLGEDFVDLYRQLPVEEEGA